MRTYTDDLQNRSSNKTSGLKCNYKPIDNVDSVSLYLYVFHGGLIKSTFIHVGIKEIKPVSKCKNHWSYFFPIVVRADEQ